jgi:hypothetical protein
MLKTYKANLVGPAPSFPAEMERNIDAYLNGEPAAGEATQALAMPGSAGAADVHKPPCIAAEVEQAANPCVPMSAPPSVIYERKDVRGRAVFTNE